MKCIIPARKGSKRIPGKNFKDFKGKPLYQWSVDIAKEAGFEDVIVSTDAEIPNTHRREEVSDSETLHEFWELWEKPFCCLLPNPLTKPEDLRKARMIAEMGYSVWSVKEESYNKYEDAGQFYFINGPKVLYKVYDSVDINTMEDWIKAEKIYAISNR